ncbi:MAG: hypothetical protein J3Q66DRAFT_437301 [Benniella sp.]|nr:MAG: hypothetical protein J3Q66DRAFT_437301 [Benniella sp.]
MGILGLWGLLKDKGYKPTLHHHPPQTLNAEPTSAPTCRLDVLGTFYQDIKESYSKHPSQTAHHIMEQKLLKVGTKDDLWLYLDGYPSQEKQSTHAQREQKRMDNGWRGQELLEDLHARIEEGRNQGWKHVVEAATEADLAIAKDCQPNDIVISRDSDLLIYPTVTKVFRPISQGRYLQYDVQDLTAVLGMNRIQFTVLGIISRNDYTSNIPSLGAKTNFKIVKGLSAPDPDAMVEQYLACPEVVLKTTKDNTGENNTGENNSGENADNTGEDANDTGENAENTEENAEGPFDKSIKVFVRLEQQVADPSPMQQDPASSHDELRMYFMEVQALHLIKKAEMEKLQQEAKRHVYHALSLCISDCTTADNAYTNLSDDTFFVCRQVATSTQGNQPRSINRYKIYDQPPKNASDAMGWNPRYTPKERVRREPHEAPRGMKRYKWKPYAVTPEAPSSDPSSSTNPSPSTDSSVPTDPSPTAPSKRKNPPPLPNGPQKQPLLKCMNWEHPTSTLDIGTISANIRGAVLNPPRFESLSIDPESQRNDVASEVERCIKDVVKYASETKRTCQLLVAGFIEEIGRLGEINESDRALLDLVCPRISVKKTEGGDTPENNEDDITLQPPKDGQTGFLYTLLIYLYSGTCNFGSWSGGQVVRFINRAHEFGLCPAVNSRHRPAQMPYPGSSFLAPVATEIGREYHRHFINGTREIHEQKKRLPSTPTAEIDHQSSAIENFLVQNALIKNRRKIAPLSDVVHKFILLAERNLVAIFCKSEVLRPLLFGLARQCQFKATSVTDLEAWIGTKEPGFLIRRFIAHVGREDQNGGQNPMRPKKTKYERRRLKSHKGAVRLLSLAEIQQHVTDVRHGSPRTYDAKGYVLRGSFRTDGHRFLLLSFKLKELNSAKYKRLPENQLPPRITSTVAGVDYYLTEIRNVVKSYQDVADLWDCDPRDIKVLGLDLGQAFVVGASAILPDQVHEDLSPEINATDKDTVMQDVGIDSSQGAGTDPPDPNTPPSANKTQQVFYNLAVSQKAVYQPTLKLRSWTEHRKKEKTDEQTESVADIESRLPPLRGPDTNVAEYKAISDANHDQLDTFYNGDNMLYKRHYYDAKRGKRSLPSSQIVC